MVLFAGNFYIEENGPDVKMPIRSSRGVWQFSDGKRSPRRNSPEKDGHQRNVFYSPVKLERVFWKHWNEGADEPNVERGNYQLNQRIIQISLYNLESFTSQSIDRGSFLSYKG